jgi:hypothetical protein
MTDEDIKGFIDYFGEENIPNPEQYPIKVAWLMKWYINIVMHNREIKNG